MFQRKPARFRHRSNDRSPRRHGHGHAQRSNSFSNGHSRNGFRPTQSPAKLLEKYNELAKEALSSGDKSLAENYLQHADHFERMISLKNSNLVNNCVDSSGVIWKFCVNPSIISGSLYSFPNISII